MKNKCFITILLNVVFCALALAEPFWNMGAFDWSEAEVSYSGVLATKSFSTLDPRPLRVHAARLSAEKVSAEQTPKDPDWGKPMPDFPSLNIATRRQTTREFLASLMEKYGKEKTFVLACNTSPWSPFSPKIPHKYANFSGMVATGGEVVSRGGARAEDYPIFFLDKKGGYGIKVPSAGEDLSVCKLAAFAFGTLLENGALFDELEKKPYFARRPSHIKRKNPLIAIGFDAKKKYIFILAIEGRMKGVSEGVDAMEMARAMRFFGASDAVLMDGGGSTTLLVVDEKTRGVKKLTRHGRRDPERTVALNLAFYLKGGAGEKDVKNESN